MKFELLPNEILLECLGYLNIFEIFYSFNHLNDYFNQFIRTIPLRLNLKNIRKSIFDQICRFLIFNPDAKNQVYSLQLSNKNTCDQIETFLSYFSLEQFSRLQSLILIEVRNENMSKLNFMLPLISQLSSFHLLDSDHIILRYPLTSNLQIVSIPIFQSIQISSSITNLTISFCSLDQLFYQIFKYTPMLEYLSIHYLSEYYNSTMNHSNVVPCKAVHLKELIISNFGYKFQDFKRLVEYTSKLTRLEFYGNTDLDIIDGNQWEKLITTSLTHLNIFKFIFRCSIYHDNILEKLNQFQTDFWQQQHQWYTEYSLSEYSVVIYTIPYMFKSYTIEIGSKRYWNQLLNTFDHIKDLTVYHATIKEPCEYYFSNVDSLTILPSQKYYKPNLGSGAIKSLKTMVNLAHLKHLGISVKFRLKDPGVLLKILHESPELSSISISIRTLETFDYDTNLCQCLNKMIKKLDIYKYGSSSFKDRYQLERFAKIFSNLEQFKCNIDQANDLIFLLKHLPKLTNLNAYLWKMNDHDYFQSWFKKQTNKFNLLFNMNYMDKHETELFVWIDRNMN